MHGRRVHRRPIHLGLHDAEQFRRAIGSRPGARSRPESVLSMSARLAGKIAIVAGAGQTPGETIGNGRAIALRFAQEGAEILCVDRDLARAQETAAMIASAGGTSFAHQADISAADECQAMIDAAVARW